MVSNQNAAYASNDEQIENGQETGNRSNVWTISRINQAVKVQLESEPTLQNVWLEGEVFNLTYHKSGHVYFSMKDENSSIRCTFFKHANQYYRDVRLANGMKILARGGITVYAPRGDYQFNVNRVMIAGEGALRMKIEQLKKKLYTEGLFDPDSKKELPYLPLTLGVATAPTGAAFQDIIRVARTRFPSINILLAPCVVQGDEAVGSIITAIEALNDPGLNVDVIIAGRGGGSFEDLMAFNEEPVVRAYAASRIPIVSAVGHEIDHPLSDYAADRYAATPSAAVEMVVPEYSDLLDRMEDYSIRLKVSLKNKHRIEKDKFTNLLKSRIHTNPGSILEDHQQNLDMVLRDMRHRMSEILQQNRFRLTDSGSLEILYDQNLSRFQRRFDIASERLQNFSPLSVLGRGFAVVRDKDKTVIRNSNQVKKGEVIEIILGEGTIFAGVTELQHKNEITDQISGR